MRDANPGLAPEEANAQAWAFGRQGLERALVEGLNFAFETTLGGNTMPGLLLAGAQGGAQIHVWYAGLASPELHIERVRRRVAAGGHDIPAHKILERYVASRVNLIKLMPHLASLRVFDNSVDGGGGATWRPRPVLLLHMQGGRVVSHAALATIPQWAKALLAAALS